ncbi:hypothetical protein ABEB36_015574 [Hypothenemus hampei]|uniref:Transposase Tc1-like domain-containing protein n=1 Tax=Hypothenemus hampei TaxID=57062 RepID=A0ABD1DZB4_HYPHA
MCTLCLTVMFGRVISEKKRAEILCLHYNGIPIKEIVRRNNVDRNTVRRVIRNVATKKVGRPRAISNRLIRRIIRNIVLSVKQGRRVTSTTIQKENQLTVSRQTIRRMLSANGVRYQKTKKKPPLKKCHKDARLAFADRHIELNTNFNE